MDLVSTPNSQTSIFVADNAIDNVVHLLIFLNKYKSSEIWNMETFI